MNDFCFTILLAGLLLAVFGFRALGQKQRFASPRFVVAASSSAGGTAVPVN